MDQALAIGEYLAVSSPEYAARVVDALFARVSQLLDFPFSGPLYKKASLPEVRELLVRPYRVVYQVTDRQIRIMGVYHQHQNP